jgi:hypothetical protein
MLLTADAAVVFLCRFEQFEMAVRSQRFASVAERLHLLR